MCVRAVRVETVSRSELVLLVYPRTRRRKSRADPGGRPVGLGPVSFPCCRIALMPVAGPWAPTVVLTPRTDQIRDCIQGLPAACPVLSGHRPRAILLAVPQRRMPGETTGRGDPCGLAVRDMGARAAVGRALSPSAPSRAAQQSTATLL